MPVREIVMWNLVTNMGRAPPFVKFAIFRRAGVYHAIPQSVKWETKNSTEGSLLFVLLSTTYIVKL
jgi:hypothetical protein